MPELALGPRVLAPATPRGARGLRRERQHRRPRPSSTPRRHHVTSHVAMNLRPTGRTPPARRRRYLGLPPTPCLPAAETDAREFRTAKAAPHICTNGCFHGTL